MNKATLLKRIEEANDSLFGNNKIVPESVKNEQPQLSQPVDLYQQNRNRAYDYSKRRYPNGTNPVVTSALNAVLPRLRAAYKKATDDSDYLLKIGDKQRASIVKQQYTESEFLPAVESIIDFSSPDDILNSEKALRELDKYAIIGNRSGSGYTASYLRTIYQDGLGNQPARSDAFVKDSLGKIRMLYATDNVTAAIGLANSLKTQIEKGQHSASDEDYETINRVVLHSQA